MKINSMALFTSLLLIISIGQIGCQKYSNRAWRTVYAINLNDPPNILFSNYFRAIQDSNVYNQLEALKELINIPDVEKHVEKNKYVKILAEITRNSSSDSVKCHAYKLLAIIDSDNDSFVETTSYMFGNSDSTVRLSAIRTINGLKIVNFDIIPLLENVARSDSRGKIRQYASVTMDEMRKNARFLVNDQGEQVNLSFNNSNKLSSNKNISEQHNFFADKPIILIIAPQISRGIRITSRQKIDIRGRVKDEIGVKWVTINGKDAMLENEGYFKQSVVLHEGENSFTITAMNSRGAISEKNIAIKHNSIQKAIVNTSNVLPRIHALVIGINKYKNSNISSLNFAESDALAFYEYLTQMRNDSTDITVEKLIGPEAIAAEIERSLKDVVRNSSDGDLVIVYMATHGLPDPEGGNDLFFLAYNSNLESLLKTSISRSDIQKILYKYTKNRKILLIVDSCHSGGIGFSSKSFALNTRSLPSQNYRLLNKLAESNNGLAILTASRENELSYEDSKWGGGHGVFTYYILKGLKGEADRNPSDGIVTLREIREYLYENVSSATNYQQTPELIGDYDSEMPVSLVKGNN